MTVTTSRNRIDHAGNGVQDTFAYDFRIFVDADLKVYIDDVLKTLNVHYTVTGAGEAGGGNVIFTSPPDPNASIPPNLSEVTICRILPYTQETDYPEGGKFPAESHERALDKLTMLVQQTKNALDAIIMGEFTPPLDVTAGGTGAVTEAEARINLGLEIGANVQAYDADLSSISALAAVEKDIIVRGASAWVRKYGGDIVRPEWLGAVGNGVTDDSTAINAAIAETVGASKTVQFANKVYLVSSPILVTYSGIHLRGQRGWTGQSGTMIKADFINASILQIYGADAAHRLETVGVDGIVVTRDANAATVGDGIFVNHVVRLVIKDSSSVNSTFGIEMRDCIDCLIDHVYSGRTADFAVISAALVFGAAAGTSCYSIKVRDLTALWPAPPHSAVAYGIFASGEAISDLWIDTFNGAYSDYGVYLLSSGVPTNYFDVQLINPIIDQFNNVGIYLEGFGGDGSVTIQGGWTAPFASGGTTHGVQIQNCEGVAVHGHQVYGAANKVNTIGINLSGTSARNSLVGNNIKQCSIGINAAVGTAKNTAVGNLIPSTSNTTSKTDAGAGNLWDDNIET